MAGWFKQYPPNTPVRQVANIKENNLIRAILDDIQGIGCRVIKPKGLMGRGWRIVVDGSSDVDPIADSYVGSDTGQVPVKPYDIAGKIDYGSCPWWRARIKAGVSTTVQISGGGVSIDIGGADSVFPTSSRLTYSLLASGNESTWTDVDITGASSGDVIYYVHDGNKPYNRTPVLKVGTTDSTYSGSHPYGAWQWLPVAVIGGTSPNYTVQRIWMGGKYMSSVVVPAGTLRLWQRVPPPGWQVLDGTGGAVDATDMGVRHNTSYLAGTTGVIVGGTAPYQGTYHGGVAPFAHTHDIETINIYGKSGPDLLASTVQVVPADQRQTLPEKAVGAVFAIKL